MADKTEKIQWHPAFYAATKLEFRADRDKLDFFPEVPISHKPLIIDLKVIKKVPKAVLQNEIGHLFKTHNIIEYKSPEDSLNIDTFYKVEGYACFYKSMGDKINLIPANEVTISLIRHNKPRELFKTLCKEGYNVEEHYQGIYYITGKIMFPAQIIVTKELPSKSHFLYKLLTTNLDREDVKNVAEAAKEFVSQDEINNLDSLLEASYNANQEEYEKFRKEENMSAYRDFINQIKADSIFEILAKLVHDKILSISEAAKRCNISEKLFLEKMKDMAF